jgi:hypothetical protein
VPDPREAGVGDRTTLLDRIRTVLDAEPDLVDAWNTSYMSRSILWRASED